MGSNNTKKMLNTLNRHREFYNQQEGVVLITDFMQFSQILEQLREKGDLKSFNALFALMEKSLNADIMIKERGKRIHKLQKGQTQPKGTGHKNLHGLKRELEIKNKDKDK
ncbi:Uncharacterised protein [Moraxella lacunata]|uniref:Uncharacterized protein n=1 Tax=Moraxella lacunata TaxID=477 RepID=A0A378T5G5_MORLA|nr:hypothetical protein [Moraxella lacunata]STZ56051.1 Uncharacterised protein [Moraxella lacunata]